MKSKAAGARASVSISADMYPRFKDDIAVYNVRMLRQISFVGMVAGAVLFLLSLPPLRVFSLLYAYLSIALLFTALYLWCCFGLDRYRRFAMPTFYLLALLMFFVASVMGTYLGQNANATTVLLLIIVLPLVVIERPLRLLFFLGLLCAGFCAMDLCVKTSEALVRLDIANCLVFYLLSIAIGKQVIETKMSDIIIKRELKQQRDIDMLTQLNNRGSFERIVAQYLHESNQKAVLLILDIDDFKSVNDSLGHASGDALLQRVGEALRGAFRSSDTVSRLGGDEFIAFLPAVEDIGIIRKKVQRLIDDLRNPADAIAPPIGVSVGLAQYPADGCSFEALYKRADAALYYAKRRGKGRCAIYEEIESAPFSAETV